MTTTSILPTGNWLNVNLYSEKELTKDDQYNALNLVRDNLKSEINSNKLKGHYFILDLTLFGDADNERIFRLVVSYISIPTNSFLPAGFDFNHELRAGFPIGDATTGSVNPPVIPPHPKGQLKRLFGNTGLTPILENLNINRSVGTVLNGNL